MIFLSGEREVVSNLQNYFHEQLVRNERLITVGRLTAALVHDINNPMQAIRGAFILALEELDDPQALRTYIQLGQKEVDRAIQLIELIRQVYRTQPDLPTELNLAHLLEIALRLTRDTHLQQQVKPVIDLAPGLPAIKASENRLQLALISLLLNLSDGLGAAGGGELHIQARANSQEVELAFTIGRSLRLERDFPLHPNEPGGVNEGSIDLSGPVEILSAQGGQVELSQEADCSRLRVTFPYVPADLGEVHQLEAA